jgi:hypothetical protein
MPGDALVELDFFAGLRMFLAVSFFLYGEYKVCQNTGFDCMFEAVAGPGPGLAAAATEGEREREREREREKQIEPERERETERERY